MSDRIEPPADRDAAAAQLAALQADRAALADRAMQPWWYDALLGLLTFAFLSSYSIAFPWVTVVALPLYLLGMRWLMSVYRRLTGTWVDGTRPGPTRRAVRVYWVAASAVLIPALVVELGLEVRGAMVVAGAVVGLTIALVSRWWSRIYIAELRGQL
ncbi:hypothetical protein OF117_16780 [Geodermatophilus sp. YIM 151500]|uniref:hypothetical protein n=1 Tax=Geodermatophilus sp. YIM 151500 TaxID=2984531 RepID=UPI0021E3ECCB|nr:hypothetical protein [Geodermatophilus sp. YIM 151500]MCV2491011.1 hypothetical protein [Geodermatophilus sp. YIM 151500]